MRETKVLWILAVVLVLASAGAAAADEMTIEYDAAKAAAGRSIFKGYCASCHGQQGMGDGPVAKYLKIPPADLTGVAARNGGEFPDEFVQEMIDGREEGVRGHGSKEMPIWGDAFQKLDDVESDDDVREKIESLTQFLRSLQ